MSVLFPYNNCAVALIKRRSTKLQAFSFSHDQRVAVTPTNWFASDLRGVKNCGWPWKEKKRRTSSFEAVLFRWFISVTPYYLLNCAVFGMKVRLRVQTRQHCRVMNSPFQFLCVSFCSNAANLPAASHQAQAGESLSTGSWKENQYWRIWKLWKYAQIYFFISYIQYVCTHTLVRLWLTWVRRLSNDLVWMQRVKASSSVTMLTSALCGTGCDLAEYFLRYVVSGIVLHDNVKAGPASRVS